MDKLNYGVIGNCCTAALISDKGSIELLWILINGWKKDLKSKI